MKNEDGQLLTTFLYNEISADKSEEIVSLREKKISVLEEIKRELEDLKKLKEAKKTIKLKIKNTKILLRNNRSEKLKLTRDLKTQQVLANDLNKLMLKEETYIFVDSFYPEKKEKAK